MILLSTHYPINTSQTDTTNRYTLYTCHACIHVAYIHIHSIVMLVYTLYTQHAQITMHLPYGIWSGVHIYQGILIDHAGDSDRSILINTSITNLTLWIIEMHKIGVPASDMNGLGGWGFWQPKLSIRHPLVWPPHTVPDPHIDKSIIIISHKSYLYQHVQFFKFC